TRAALIAALYSALTIPLGAISSQSFLQIRPAEALTMLPLLFAEAVPGLAIGCMIANIFGGYGIYDIVFGSLITLAAALLTRKIKKPLIAGLPPVLLNAALLPLIWIAFSAETIYLYSFFSTLLTQTVWVYGLGLPMYYVLKKRFEGELINKK
ncbi:MAG: QueT transporter family protein, partial [Clostridia bacterium]|nr:QueT transporter family protein [Clostridia bacterium]